MFRMHYMVFILTLLVGVNVCASCRILVNTKKATILFRRQKESKSPNLLQDT